MQDESGPLFQKVNYFSKIGMYENDTSLTEGPPSIGSATGSDAMRVADRLSLREMLISENTGTKVNGSKSMRNQGGREAFGKCGFIHVVEILGMKITILQPSS